MLANLYIYMIQYSTQSNTPEFYATLAQVQESRNAAMYEYTRVALVCMNSERTVAKRARTISKGSPKNINDKSLQCMQKKRLQFMQDKPMQFMP